MSDDSQAPTYEEWSWSTADFGMLNIDVVDRTPQRFFGIKALPGLPDAIPHAVLTEPVTGREQEFAPDRAHGFHRLLRDTLGRDGSCRINYTDRFVDSFLERVPGGCMELVRYAGGMPRRDVRPGRKYPLVVNNKETLVPSWYSIMRKSNHVPGCLFRSMMFVDVDEKKERHRDAVPRLLACAMAGITKENARRRAASEEELAAAPVLLVSFLRSAPSFYKVHITPELVRAVAEGTHPSSITVEHLVPPLPSPHLFEEWGMCPLDNRKVLLQCFVACSEYMDETQLAEGGEWDIYQGNGLYRVPVPGDG